MRSWAVAFVLLVTGAAKGVIIDRIALVTGNSIVKDSDIERDIRVTDFLNRVPLSFAPAARKASAARLIDQIFIREEIRAGDYSRASKEEADRELTALIRKQVGGDVRLAAELQKYGITESELREQFRWQLTVLHFVDLRFKPAAYVSDDEVAAYYNQHVTQLRAQYPGRTTLDELRPDITNLLVGEKTNQLFFAWLDEQRKNAQPQYHEEALR